MCIHDSEETETFTSAPALGVGIMLTLCSLIVFSANVIQYGMDQLHDAPTDDLILFIHWHVWTSYLTIFILSEQALLHSLHTSFINGISRSNTMLTEM